jgi:hypothetical protein
LIALIVKLWTVLWRGGGRGRSGQWVQGIEGL